MKAPHNHSVVEVNGKTAFTYHGESQLALEEANLQLAMMIPEASQPPKLLHYVLPVMTREERKQGYEGLVKVQFLVGRDGRVSEVKILASPGVSWCASCCGRGSRVEPMGIQPDVG